MEVQFENVSRRFDDTEVLKRVSAVIPRGRKLALVGPNGSGKSTLTRILMGMLAYEGKVLLNGKSPLENRVEIAKRLAYVPQSPPQLSVPVGTLLKAVSKLRGQAEADFVAAAARLELDVLHLTDRSLKSLSAGMKQKLLIALAFAAKPEMLILDEPTASLDPVARTNFYECFHDVAEHTTLILCSHRVEEIQHLVEHVIVLDAGTVAFDGSLTQFLRGKTNAMVEVSALDDSTSEWLTDFGFMRTGARAWSKIVSREEKVPTARILLEKMDGQLTNVNIRDLDVVSIPLRKEVP